MTATVPMVSHRITFEWVPPNGGQSWPVAVDVAWWADIPFEVQLTFHTRARPCWVLGRDFLAEGAYFAVGEGDVRLRPSGDPEWLLLTLSSPTGKADLRVPTHALGSFLAGTYAIVLAGAERLPDSLFEELMS